MKSIYWVLALLSIALIFPKSSYSCSIINQPTKKFDTHKYVFGGEVIGYTKLYKKSREASLNLAKETKTRKSKRNINKFYKQWFDPSLEVIGLKVIPKQIINSPKLTDDYFEVLPFRFNPTCFSEGIYKDKDKIVKDFPIGTKVFVTASKSHYFPNKTYETNIRLESHYKQFLIQYDYSKIPYDIYSDGVDYKNLKIKNISQRTVALVELEKDLKRLESDNYEIRTNTLKRLVYYPFKHIIDYNALVQNYLTEGDINRTLFPELRNDYLAIKNNK